MRILLALILLATPLAAQGRTLSEPSLHLLGGLHLVNVTGATAHLALLRGRHVDAADSDDIGPVLSGEVGQFGGRIGIGRGGWGGFGGGLMRVSYLRTWGEDRTVDPGQGFLGFDFRMTFILPAVGVGYYRHVSGDDTRHRDLLLLSAGIGF